MRTLVWLTLLAVTFGCSANGGGGAPPGGSGSNPLSQAQIDAFVSAHNQARSGPLVNGARPY